MHEALKIIRCQGVHIDVIATADDIAKACPEWSDFILRLKERAQENLNMANEFIKNN